MALVSLRGVSFTWSGPALLENINVEINAGERIGLLGRNGFGKSTLMKILTGELAPDHGERWLQDGVRIGQLVQDVPAGTTQTIAEIVAQGFRPEDIEARHLEPWEVQQAVDRQLTLMNLHGEAPFAQLSSGMKRRALLAQALVAEPQLLLLDEPTNHLDIDAITWLEGFLQSYSGAILFVTHDRVFLQALATRILEIDRGKLFDWTCDYATFLKRKEQALHAEEQQNQLFDRKLAEEEVWIRQGIKARRTRNEGRVRALEKMREERSQRRERMGNVSLQASEAERSGRLVMEAKGISFGFGDQKIVDNFSTLISRGDKIGIIGPNGAGKSTLLKLLLGELKPAAGTIRQGTNLQVIYFDQLRESIEEEKSVVENVGEGQETITINGASKHIMGYLQDFLFSPDRARRPARYLSGGERNRLMLARLFKKPSNIMVLDEPTNDLDEETLELLEELVSNYPGTVLLVSHDRAFLNHVATSTIVFEGKGKLREYDGGYDDYLRQRHAQKPDPIAKADPKPVTQERPKERARKLTFKEQQELASLPELIEELEAEQRTLHQQMADPGFFKQPAEKISAATGRLEEIGNKLPEMYERWETLAALE